MTPRIRVLLLVLALFASPSFAAPAPARGSQATPRAPEPARGSQATPRAPEPLNGIESSLTIYVYPPRNRIDWTTPGSALRTTIGNLVSVGLSMDGLVHFLNGFGEPDSISANYRSGIGHTLNHLRCRLPGGELYDHWASLTGQNFHQVDTDLLLRRKLGFGVLFYDYVDGLILSGAENTERLAFYKGDDDEGYRVHPRYLQLEIGEQGCADAKRMVEFFESFHYGPGTTLEQLEARGPEKTLYFTNQIDPYDSYEERLRTGKGRVGGGCAPFAAALTKITGRYVKDFDSLWRTPVTVSQKLIGGWRGRDGRVNQVSVGSLLFTPLGGRWRYDEEGYPNRHVDLYDPQRIWDFAGSLLGCLAGDTRCARWSFYHEHRAELRRGRNQVFRGTYQYRVQRGPGLSDEETVTQGAAQPVDGVVWRLAR